MAVQILLGQRQVSVKLMAIAIFTFEDVEAVYCATRVNFLVDLPLENCRRALTKHQ